MEVGRHYQTILRQQHIHLRQVQVNVQVQQIRR